RPGPLAGPAGRLVGCAGRTAGPLARQPVSLTATVGLTLGALELDVDLEVDEASVVAVVGPNGAGKTTLLRVLAGLVPLGRGRITIGETVVEDVASGVRVASEHRGVGVVFQEHRLFANLTALENVA